MKKLLILGAGTAGTIMLNKLHKKLSPSEWQITIVDKDKNHYYQPGFLFVPFGTYSKERVVRQKTEFFPEGADVIWDEVVKIDAEENHVYLKKGSVLGYDLLIIATGTTPQPEETDGLFGDLWYKDIHEFYTYEGAVKLYEHLKTWKGGNLVVNIVESMIKCPIAPLEFVFLADDFFTKKGMRDKVDIFYVTPLPGAFTKPKASAMLTGLLVEKNIKVIPDFYIEHVNNEEKKIVSYDGQEVPFDLLVSVPTNMGADMIEESNMGDDDDLNFVPTDKHTLQAKGYENIFVIGDATNVPTSKAGSVVHFEADILTQNILSFIEGKPLEATFDGHANCFIESGFGKATLIDFNYETEPLPGKFPLPLVGPLDLLKMTKSNHLGKLAFEWVYWHMLLKGKHLPVPTNMSMAGKKV